MSDPNDISDIILGEIRALIRRAVSNAEDIARNSDELTSSLILPVVYQIGVLAELLESVEEEVAKYEDRQERGG